MENFIFCEVFTIFSLINDTLQLQVEMHIKQVYKQWNNENKKSVTT